MANSIKIAKIPDNQKTTIWNIVNNKLSEISIAKYNRIMKGSEKATNHGTGKFPDWAKKNYRLDEFPGEPRTIYHVASSTRIDFMTQDLFDEIKRRNPVDPNLLDENGKAYEYWKEHLATSKEIKAAISNTETPEQRQLKLLTKQLELLQKQMDASKGKDFEEKPEKASKKETAKAETEAEETKEPVADVHIKQTPEKHIDPKTNKVKEEHKPKGRTPKQL